MRLVLAEWRRLSGGKLVRSDAYDDCATLYTGTNLESTGSGPAPYGTGSSFMVLNRQASAKRAQIRFRGEPLRIRAGSVQFFVYTGPALRDGGSETARI